MTHRNAIDQLLDKLVSNLRACEQTVNRKSLKGKQYIKPGWNDEVKIAYQEYRQFFLEWVRSGRSDTSMFQRMKESRKLFKRALKKIQSRKQSIHDEKLAQSFDGNYFYKFWKHVKSVDSKDNTTTLKLAHAEGDSDICKLWELHYTHQFSKKDHETKRCCNHNTCDEQSTRNKGKSQFRVSASDVYKCIQRLKCGKAKGPDQLSAETLKYAHPIIMTVLASLFNSCIAHGYVPDNIMRVVIIPLLKKKGLDPSVIKNYRPIAISSAISKVFELLILSKYEHNLYTQAGQFGYKKGVGTETAVFTLRQVAHHYLRKNTPVFLCYLDATAAFDNVSHATLLNKLCKRGFDDETLNFLEFWFNNQMFYCRWKSLSSNPFPVRVGVKQGSICSPWYFAVYTDEMYCALQNSDIGCRAGNVICNYLAYADDTILMANTISGLKILISICEEFGQQLHITFNPLKSFLQCFIPIKMGSDKPTVHMCNKEIPWSDNVKYLGYEISCWNRDTNELMRRKRELYMQANLVASRFRSCNIGVKKYIFNTYFSNIYCASLWNPVCVKSLHAVKVAYNDSFRILFGYNRRCSASAMFVRNGICDFTAVRRRAVMSLLTRLARSSNPILINIFNSRMFLDSSLYQTWRSLLLGTANVEGQPNQSLDLYRVINGATQDAIDS